MTSENEETKQTEETQPAAKPKPKQRQKGLIKSAMPKTGGASIATVRGMPRKRVVFEVDAGVCAPGIFDGDFELTLVSPSPETELQAAKKSGGDPTSLAFWMAFYSLDAVNGEAIDDGEGEREWLWNALGHGGRSIVMGIFGKAFMGGIDAQGKALGSVRVL